MTENKLRAVLTIFGSNNKLLEIRFDGLNSETTTIKVNSNEKNRHSINGHDFIQAFINLTEGINKYANSLKAKIIIGKIMGMW